jgi:hypothetical protein
MIAEGSRRACPTRSNRVEAIAAIKAEKKSAHVQAWCFFSPIEMEALRNSIRIYIKTITLKPVTMMKMAKPRFIYRRRILQADLPFR